ncbi:ABC transporter substrate-binding protein [Roseomonas sp. SSH11]|uniref:ABC transporter substrate-binding protein n=1 Tax=Pararoseomonas baculiformis TaxID=2820812 RepID=A0ABS4AHM5_9PROT|nr:ABC transporter substrate-binding protein [Pararoseomonas baculiformis]MBP0446035.1 ABC transporter substrate-binding protein [Pararoseomonas baculiformis]
MGTRYRIERRSLLAGGAAFALVPVAGARVSAQSLDKVVFQTDWRAQAEHGGYYQAVAKGIYRKHGIDCDLRQGGPQQNPAQMLVGGRADMIMSNPFQALNYARDNIPFLCIAAIFQKDPVILMTHEEAGIDSFEKMRGKPISISAAGRVTHWPFLRSRFGFDDSQIRPKAVSLQPFMVDRTSIYQGLVSSEPFSAIQAGARPRVHLLADAGYEAYNTTIDVSRKMIAERREVVQRFIDATMEGWADYMKGEDVAAANALIRQHNPEMPDELMAYGLRAMKERGIVQSNEALTLGIGAMTNERWDRFYAIMRETGVYPAGLDIRRGYSLDFVNRKVGLG